MVLVDGQPVPSCVTPVETVSGAEIVTLEGLGSEHAPHPLQAAFFAEQAAQCGYCVGGIIVVAAALLERNPDPRDGSFLAVVAEREEQAIRAAERLRDDVTWDEPEDLPTPDAMRA